MTKGIGAFSAILQYFGKDPDDSVDIMYSNKQGKLKKDVIEYNGNSYYSITAFVQKAFNEIHDNDTRIGSTQLAKTLINNIEYTTIRDSISRSPKSVVVKYYSLDEHNSRPSVENRITFSSTKEQQFELFPNITLSIRHLSDGLIQLEFFSKRDAILEIQIAECNFHKTFTIKQDAAEFFDTPMSAFTTTTATLSAKLVKPESFKIEFDEVTHNIIVFTYPQQQVWGKGKASNSQEPITYTNINTTTIHTKTEDTMEIGWKGGKANITKTDLFDFSNIVSIYTEKLESPTADLNEKKQPIGTGFFLPGKKWVLTSAHIVEGTTGKLRIIPKLNKDSSADESKEQEISRNNVILCKDFALIPVDTQATAPKLDFPSIVQYSNESPIFTIGNAMNIIDGNIVYVDSNHSRVVANFSTGSPGAPVVNSDGILVAIVSHAADPVLSRLVPIDTITEQFNNLKL